MENIENQKESVQTPNKTEKFSLLDWVVLTTAIIILPMMVFSMVREVLSIIISGTFDFIKILAGITWIGVLGWLLKIKLKKFKNIKTEKSYKIIRTVSWAVGIFFALFALLVIFSVVMSVSKSSSTKISPEQTSFVNELNGKFQEFSGESDGVKVTMQSFIDVIQNKEYSKIHETLKNLLTATQMLQPKIDELKAFSQQGVSLSKNEKDQVVFNLYLKAIDLRDQDNKKLIEMATFGLSFDWENSTDAQIAMWGQLVDELSIIENKIQSTEAELQNSL